ncbi:hypothetical protein GK047_07975 [Paenibacillus sp. SYP-B3998]|uniref:Uncharacterized protein n=1 Tax=Paenibacillus sp. SYP-B3998 TaxID=2678564 RepID=A0A6G3ZV04_9BACL|nr:hypothetical protein [Paenibacillus sp. SYP-B3998]NEW05945.1 hypothetical protein [Paenibacillus sp. SYP-B3998]
MGIVTACPSPKPITLQQRLTSIQDIHLRVKITGLSGNTLSEGFITNVGKTFVNIGTKRILFSNISRITVLSDTSSTDTPVTVKTKQGTLSGTLVVIGIDFVEIAFVNPDGIVTPEIIPLSQVIKITCRKK